MTQKKYWEKEATEELRQFSFASVAEKNLREEITYLDESIEAESDEYARRDLIRRADSLKKRLLPIHLRNSRMIRSLEALEYEKRCLLEEVYMKRATPEDIMDSFHFEHSKFYKLRLDAIHDLVYALYGIDLKAVPDEPFPSQDEI